jgi:hypothetical protein
MELAARVKKGAMAKTAQGAPQSDPSADDKIDEMGTDVIQSSRKMSIDVAEVYSLPRVTPEAKKFGMTAGEAVDLTTG